MPEHYLLGFDEQKIETEGLPRRYMVAAQVARQTRNPAVIEEARRLPETASEEKAAYPVYLDGEVRNTGWATYYLKALIYKIPEGTWLLVALSVVALVVVKRSRAGWFDELALWTMPVLLLLAMSLLTDINLGLRYVLAILPFIYIATGKVVPWCLSLSNPWRRIVGTFLAGSMALTLAASAWIHPHYLSYFNWASGGPDREPPHLIDSNLDWGQDLVALQKWCKANIPGQEIGLAYFGQINPSLFTLRNEPFRWFLPPGLPGTVGPIDPQRVSPRFKGPSPRLAPGYYAVSAHLLYGLAWRLYDSAPLATAPEAFQPVWSYGTYRGKAALQYFRDFRPIMPPIGHTIYVYHLTAEDVAPINRVLEASRSAGHDSGRFSADINLGQVVVSRRAEEDVDLETRMPEQIGQIGAELGEDRVAPVTAGVGDPRGAVLDTPIGTNDRAGERPRRLGQEGHREDVAPAGHQNSSDLPEGGIDVGDMLERLGGQHQVEDGVGISQPRQVLRADALDQGARHRAGLIVGRRESQEAQQTVMQSIDAVDLGDAQRLDFGILDPPGQRSGRGRGVTDGVERQDGLVRSAGIGAWRRMRSSRTTPSAPGPRPAAARGPRALPVVVGLRDDDRASAGTGRRRGSVRSGGERRRRGNPARSSRTDGPRSSTGRGVA